MNPASVSEDLLQGYVDGRVSAAERADIERYLAERPLEAARIAAYRDHRDAIGAAFAGVLEEPVPQRLRVGGSKAGRSHLARAAAVLAAVALGGLLGWLLRGHIESTAAEGALVERARMAHTIYTREVRRAVEVAASQEDDMIRWLSKRMRTAVRVPKLDQFGFEAMGGRLLPGAQGPACQIMYQNAAGKRLTIYLARDPHGLPKPVRFSDSAAVHVVFWSDGTLAFAVSAELGNETLQRIAAVVAKAAER